MATITNLHKIHKKKTINLLENSEMHCFQQQRKTSKEILQHLWKLNSIGKYNEDINVFMIFDAFKAFALFDNLTYMF